ncbi:MAG: helix-turn-helix domain containing protein, partial [Chloroflexi bacterium]|nr:helix-turn-helix domain containing protein [Chloroflexota bacterium]
MAKPADPNRREDILQAAREVFKQNGYAKAHVAEIAQLAGVAKGTVYLYFASKQAMLDALCDSYQEMVA